MMKKSSLFIVILVCALSFMGCERKDNNQKETNTKLPVDYVGFPAFVVETVNASKGEKDVIVRVSLKNNPGFLTMAMNIEYDSETITLIEALNGSDYEEYHFVGPKNLKSGCKASWFIPKMSENTGDGIILELHFDIRKEAKEGAYPITISCGNNGDIVDRNKEAIVFNNAMGYIKIK